jgi:hypothetical protein
MLSHEEFKLRRNHCEPVRLRNESRRQWRDQIVIQVRSCLVHSTPGTPYLMTWVEMGSWTVCEDLHILLCAIDWCCSYRSCVFAYAKCVLSQTARRLGYRLRRVELKEVTSPLPPSDRPTLFVLPFYELTSGLVDMHNVDDHGNCEATHFCNSPYVWEHVYDRVHRAMQLAGFDGGGVVAEVRGHDGGGY